MTNIIQFFPSFIAVLQIYYLYQINITSSMGNLPLTPTNIAIYLMSILSIYIASFICLNIFKKPTARLLSVILFLFLFNIQISYHFASNQLFNWAFFADNAGLLFSTDSIYTVVNSLDLPTLAYWPVLSIIILWVDFKRKNIRLSSSFIKGYHLIGLLIFYVAIIFMPIRSYDPFVSLFKSVVFYYNSPLNNKNIVAKKPNNSIALSDVNSSGKKNKRPDIFLILVESLNYNHQSITDEKNRPVTPFLNQLSQNATTIDYFYGNSVQTAKGMAATLFSSYPSFSGKLFTKFKSLTFDSPFDELKSLGYASLFYLGHDNLDYDNRREFLKKHRIDYTKTVYDDIDESDQRLSTMWGIRDDRLMMHFFNYFDQLKKDNQGAPLFSVILTSQSHVPFILPKPMRKAYENANSIQEHYANCLVNIDAGIEYFFTELEKRGLTDDAIVIITGDHAFPMGQHNITSLEAGYFEESYRMPFFLKAPGIKPKKLKGAYSQVDIIPTIFDLLDYSKEDTMFVGQSIFLNNPDNYVLQIQPYEKQIGIVNLPFKYRYSLKTNKEYVYNLEADPLEQDNIISTLGIDELSEFREQVEGFYEIQKFYELNKK